MIKKLSVKNLNNRITGDFEFHNDLNIMTGKNGCGKTTILKLMWYMVSGNFDKIFDEMYFDSASVELEGDLVIKIEVVGDETSKKIQFSITGGRRNADFNTEFPFNTSEGFLRFQSPEGSLFFPTFRRIEGGFATTPTNNRPSRFRRNTLREALDSVSENLTTSFNHKFVASVSTEDINYLLSNKYADISEEIRKLEANQSRNILNIVSNSQDKEKESLEEIRNIVRDNDAKKNEILRPIFVLSGLVNKIFKEKSIKISNNLELGEAKDAIFSDKLSAGEKQMLSFLCYNFFFDNTIIFIDEPELSLHTDWQRLLFPTLLKQKKQNQFIIATHSPFIYSKYTDKEIIIDQDKGNKDVE